MKSLHFNADVCSIVDVCPPMILRFAEQVTVLERMRESGKVCGWCGTQTVSGDQHSSSVAIVTFLYID